MLNMQNKAMENFVQGMKESPIGRNAYWLVLHDTPEVGIILGKAKFCKAVIWKIPGEEASMREIRPEELPQEAFLIYAEAKLLGEVE